MKKPDPIPLTKLSLNSCQNLSLPWPNVSAGFLPWVPPGLPVSVLSILDKRGSSISKKVQSWNGSLETLSLPGSCVLVQGEQALVAALLPEGRIKSTGGEKELSPMSPSKSSSDPWSLNGPPNQTMFSACIPEMFKFTLEQVDLNCKCSLIRGIFSTNTCYLIPGRVPGGRLVTGKLSRDF